MKAIKAEFVGQTSCGFVSNIIYEIKIKQRDKWIWVYDKHSSAKCPYESLQSLAQNWKAPVPEYEIVGHFSYNSVT